MAPVDNCPPEILLAIFADLPAASLRAAASVCRAWQGVAQEAAARQPCLATLDRFERVASTANPEAPPILRVALQARQGQLCVDVDTLSSDRPTYSQFVQGSFTGSKYPRHAELRNLVLAEDGERCLIRLQEQDHWVDQGAQLADWVVNLQTGSFCQVAVATEATFSQALWTDLESQVSVERTRQGFNVRHWGQAPVHEYLIPAPTLPLWCASAGKLAVEGEDARIHVYSLATGERTRTFARPPGQALNDLRFLADELLAFGDVNAYIAPQNAVWQAMSPAQVRHAEAAKAADARTRFVRDPAAPVRPGFGRFVLSAAAAGRQNALLVGADPRPVWRKLGADAAAQGASPHAPQSFVDLPARPLLRPASKQVDEKELSWWVYETFFANLLEPAFLAGLRQQGGNPMAQLMLGSHAHRQRISYAMLREQGLFLRFPWLEKQRANAMLEKLEAMRNHNSARGVNPQLYWL